MTEDNLETSHRKILEENFTALKKAVEVLQYSYKKCTEIGIRDKYDDEALEAFEALSSRFARAADILTQKVFTSLFTVLQETPKSFIDKINLAEKLGVIKTAERVFKIRELRNEIAHEYRFADVTSLFQLTLDKTEDLLSVIQEVNQYIEALDSRTRG